jgi:hypothetical protein
MADNQAVKVRYNPLQTVVIVFSAGDGIIQLLKN